MLAPPLVALLLAAAPQAAAPPASHESLDARREAYVCTSAPRGAALVACRRALELGLNAPHAATVNLVLGLHLAALGRWDEVVAVYHERARLTPENADAHWRLGDALFLGLAQPELALGPLREAVRLDPRLAGAYVSLGVALNATGAQGESLAAFDEAVRLDPRILENRPGAQRVREAARNGRRWAP